MRGRPSSSQQTEVLSEALEPDDERAVHPVNTETPDAVEGGQSDEPLETTKDGRPAALRVKRVDSTENRFIDTGGPIEEVVEVVELLRTVRRIEAGISSPRILCFLLIVPVVGKEFLRGLRAPASEQLPE